MENILTKFGDFLGIFESVSSKSEEAKEAMVKVKKALFWLSVHQPFYAELLQYLTIGGSYSLNPKTMATDGTKILFHPEFVNSQTKEAIRFVLCHEILHCIGKHMERKGGRNHKMWNYACDYAINPILKGEIGMKMPEWTEGPEKGKEMGLFEDRYVGMRAEDIYDILEKEGLPPISRGIPLDDVEEDDDLPFPDEDMIVSEGSRIQEDDPDNENENEDEQEEEHSNEVKVGDTVILDDGSIHKVNNVYPNLDIEI